MIEQVGIPKYRRIVSFLKLLPPTVPVLATTATANARVVEDVQEQFGGKLHVMRGPFVRESLRLQTLQFPKQPARLAWLVKHLGKLPGTGIIYCLTVRDARRVSEWLERNGIAAPVYSGQMDDSQRPVLEQALLNNKVKALVATSALGMGFDKPDMGFVVHFQRPASVVHYYQQVGRAGRKLDSAVGILLGGAEDDEIAEYFIESAFPPAAQMKAVLATLEQIDDGASIPELQASLNLSQGALEKVLTLAETLVPAPVTKQGSRYKRTPVHYAHDPERINKLLALRKEEQRVMQVYMSTLGAGRWGRSHCGFASCRRRSASVHPTARAALRQGWTGDDLGGRKGGGPGGDDSGARRRGTRARRPPRRSGARGAGEDLPEGAGRRANDAAIAIRSWCALHGLERHGSQQGRLRAQRLRRGCELGL
nr:helicase-related protein [Hyalangium minutum]